MLDVIKQKVIGTSKRPQVEAECEVLGFPQIRKGMTVDIRGNDRFKSVRGNYWYVTSVSHIYSKGTFVTRFKVEAENLDRRDMIEQAEATDKDVSSSYVSENGVENLPVFGYERTWDTFKGRMPEVGEGENKTFYNVTLNGLKDLGTKTGKRIGEEAQLILEGENV